MAKFKVAFVCIHNSCRSQMAEAWMKKLGSDIFDAYSAGTEEYSEVKPLAVQVLTDEGLDMTSHYPKLLKDIPSSLDVLITMGCNVLCPFVDNRYQEDWGVEDPSGGSIEDFRVTRNLIKVKVEKLIEKIKNKEI